MTEQPHPATTEPTTPTDPVDETGPTVEDATEEHDTPNAQAAKYRRRLREVEATRDALAAKVQGYQRREVEQLAASKMARPQDVWLVRPELAELFDDQGDIDAERVTAAVEAVIAERPSWRVQRVVDWDGGPRGAPVTPAPSWADVIGGSHR